jgi:hypothetical protein
MLYDKHLPSNFIFHTHKFLGIYFIFCFCRLLYIFLDQETWFKFFRNEFAEWEIDDKISLLFSIVHHIILDYDSF